MEWFDGSTLPLGGKVGRSNGTVDDGRKKVGDDGLSSNESNRGKLVKTSSTPRF